VPSPDLKADIRALALDLGFSDCRVAAAKPAAHRELFEQWVAEGKYGDMAWMARNLERRTDPTVVLPGAKAVVVFALNYFQGEPPPGQLEGRIARYAWNEDYHDLIESKLKKINAHMEDLGGTQRYYVDTGPVLERDFAGEAGLGWNGKSTMQIHRSLGAWFFLAEIITTLDIEPDPPAKDMCGKCIRCMVACPTQAITAPRRMDARRCISYLTIEHKGSIPLEFRKAIGERIYGCDDCLAACPWNKFAHASHEAAFQARETVFGMKLRDFLKLTEETFRELFRKSPIKRIKRPAFLRNVCVALGNVGTMEDMPALKEAAQDEHPLIAEHARWAVDEILRRAA
jgi:epoxyqueuosine reductase